MFTLMDQFEYRPYWAYNLLVIKFVARPDESLWVSLFRVAYSWILAIMCKQNVVHKPEVHSISHCHQRRTERLPWVTCVGIRVYSSICPLNLHTRNRFASQSRQLVRPRCLAGWFPVPVSRQLTRPGVWLARPPRCLYTPPPPQIASIKASEHQQSESVGSWERKSALRER